MVNPTKLCPESLRTEITEWRNDNLSYDEILQRLRARNITVGRSTLHRTLRTWNLVATDSPGLESLRVQIKEWYIKYGFSIAQIVSILRNSESTRTVTERTLRYHLNTKWNVRQQPKFQIADNPQIVSRICHLFYQCMYDDDQILEEIRDDGFSISKRTLATVRKNHGMERRHNHFTDQEEHRYRTIIQNQLDKGVIDSYGRKYLHVHFRTNGFNIARDKLFRITREINPEGVRRRLEQLKKHRGAFISPGPNWMWSIDAHLKLQYWGIEVYAIIDAYSRYIVSSYVGISATTAISCVRLYLDGLEEGEFQPQYIRSDRGNETLLIADAHFTLSRTIHPDIQFRDCYRYGTSKENQRIEAWWRQLGAGCLYKWRVSLDIVRLRREGH
jgi:hypothetical protein